MRRRIALAAAATVTATLAGVGVNAAMDEGLFVESAVAAPQHVQLAAKTRVTKPKPRIRRVQKPKTRPTHKPTSSRPPVVRRHLSTAAWATSAKARSVIKCESGGDITMFEKNGKTWYFGKWSMDAQFIRDNGHVDAWAYVHHGKFTMSEAQQDEIAHEGYTKRGWQPWTCA